MTADRSRRALARTVLVISTLTGLATREAPAQPPVRVPSGGLNDPDSTLGPINHLIQWTSYHNAGWRAMGKGWYDTAEREFLASFRAARRADPPARTRMEAQSYASLAWALQKQGKAREAEPLARWALEVWRSQNGPGSDAAARTMNQVAGICVDLDKGGEAEALARRLIALEPGKSTVIPQEQARAQSLLGLLRAGQRQYAQAEREYARAVALRESALGSRAAETGDEWNNLAWCRIEQGKLPEARYAMDKALAILEAARGPRDPTVARAVEGLARIDAEQGDLGAAESEYLRLIAIATAGGDAQQPRLVDALKHYADLLDRAGRPRDAEPIRARLARLQAPTTRPDPPTTTAHLSAPSHPIPPAPNLPPGRR